MALDPYDLARSKLERNIQRDRYDVRHLARTVPFDPAKNHHRLCALRARESPPAPTGLLVQREYQRPPKLIQRNRKRPPQTQSTTSRGKDCRQEISPPAQSFPNGYADGKAFEGCALTNLRYWIESVVVISSHPD